MIFRPTFEGCFFFCISTEGPAFAVGTSAQKANLITLTKALELSQGKHVNFYTDFVVVHAHGATWKERRLLTSGNKDIKHAKEMLQLLEAVNPPKQIAIMHCPGHQKHGSPSSQGNQTAIKAARQTSQGQLLLGLTFPTWTCQH